MISANLAISRFRRDLTVGMMLKIVLIVAAATSIAMGVWPPVVFGLLAGIWLILSFHSAAGSRLASGSSSLIASGQYTEAEKQIEESLRRFSIFRTSKLVGLHHLALLRHAQQRWADSAALCRAILEQRLGSLRGLSKTSRLMLADALLELEDLVGAQQAINGLFAEHLALPEALNLLQVQSDYLARVGAWEQLFHPIATKVQLAELLPTNGPARVQALLALAARRIGRTDWERWLKRRVELLTDVDQLVIQRPILSELWPATRKVDSGTGDDTK